MPSTLELLSRQYRREARRVEVRTEDGVLLRGHRLGEGDVALVFCHGFLGWHRKPRLVAFQERLAERFTVYAFDFRGHGRSGGLSAFGAEEHLDVEAAVRRAKEDGFRRVATFGGSMGGIAVVRHAALRGGVDAVISVSTPATWDGHETEAVGRVARATATRSGRRLLRSIGIRVVPEWVWAESPVDLVGRVAPIPLVVIHGRDDHFFDEEQAWALYRMAGEPKRLLIADRFGHAEDGYTASFASHVRSVVLEAIERRPRGKP